MNFARFSTCVALVGAQGLLGGIWSFADDTQVALDEANELARTRLVQYNRLDGIEHVGGPFLLKDYTVSSTPLGGGQPGLHVEYRYRRPRGLEGAPDEFDIVVFLAHDPWHRPKDPAPPEYTPFKTVGNFSKEELEQVLDVYRCFGRELGGAEFDMADIDVNQKLTRRRVVKYGVQEVRRLGPDRAQVVFGFASFLRVVGSHVSLVRGDMGWRPTLMFETWGTQVVHGPPPEFRRRRPGPVPLPQSVRVLGDLADPDLLQIIDSVRWIDGVRTNILEVTKLSDSVSVVSGEREPVKHDHLVTLERKQDQWIFQRAALMMNFRESRYLPLLPQPPQQKVAAVAKAAKVRGKLSESDTLAICALFLRLPEVDREQALSIAEDGTGKVSVMTGKRGGDSVTLKKVKGVWIIVSVGQWIT